MRRAIVLLATLLLASCDDRPRDIVIEAEKRELQELTITTRANLMGNSLAVVILPDGTRCVMVDGIESVAIDCDWRAAP